MAHDVFISASSKDKPATDAVCTVLERNRIRVWMAPRDIVPGAGWAASIIEAIKGTKIMVLVFSSHANNSPQIEREVERAVNKGIPVIPFRVENVEPSDALEYFISAPHWLDAFTPPLEPHLERLVAAVRRLLDSEIARVTQQEERHKAAEVEAARLAEEERQRREAAEAARRAEEERRRAEAEAAHVAEDERQRQEAEEAARQVAEEQRRRAEAEAEESRRAEEEWRAAVEVDAARAAEKERQRQAAAEATRQVEEERLRIEAEADRQRQMAVSDVVPGAVAGVVGI
jgi:flagellar biosynthesis GTPase FlhF